MQAKELAYIPIDMEHASDQAAVLLAWSLSTITSSYEKAGSF